VNSARHNDTIVAIATAHGAAGVGIVRISGPDAVDIVRSIFRRGRSFRRVVSFPTHQMLHGVIVDGHETPVDDVLCCVMHGPHSYTAEDVAEIHTHGGDIVLRRVLALCREHRARPAQPGEFTLRAFLNGRPSPTSLGREARQHCVSPSVSCAAISHSDSMQYVYRCSTSSLTVKR